MDKLFFKDRLNLQIKQWIPLIAGLFITTTFFTFLYYDYVETEILLLWTGFSYLLVISRFAIAKLYLNNRLNHWSQQKWAWVVNGFPILSGVLVACIPIFFFIPEKGYLTAISVAVIAGMTAGSIPGLSVFPIGYYGFTLVACVPMGLRLMNEGGTLNTILAFLVFAFIIAMMVYSFNLYRMVMDSIRLRYEKQNLLLEVQKQKEQAEHANLAKSRFFAAASHDLRQPLHAMGLCLSLLRKNYIVNDEPKALELVDMLNQSLGNQTQLFDAILDIAKLDSGRIKAAIDYLPLRGLCQELEDEFALLAKEKQLGFKLHMEQDYAIYSDPILLKRVLKNLINNALKYTQEGLVSLKIHERDKQIEFLVIDSGPGISESEQENIFKEFYQIQSSSSQQNKGLGLGLSIVTKLLDLLESHIQLQSTPGKGACFSFSLPMAKAANKSSTEVLEANHETLDLAQQQILIIDDDLQTLKAMSLLLQVWGGKILACHDYQDALHSIVQDNYQPALIIMDYRLGNGITGIEALEEILPQLDESPEVLFISADTAPEVLAKINQYGYDLLHKPTAAETLRQAIAQKLSIEANS